MAQAEALNFPLIVPFASTILGLILLMRRDFAACAALSSRQLEFCAEHGFVFWSAAHQILAGRRPRTSRWEPGRTCRGRDGDS